MRRIAIILWTVAAAVGAAAQSTPKTYTLDVGDFSGLKVIDDIPVEYVCSADSAGKVTFTAPDASVQYYIFSNSKGTLKVSFTDDAMIRRPEVLPLVRVYSNHLEKVENDGDSLVTVRSLASGASFKATVIGNGAISAPCVHATRVDAQLRTGRGRIVLGGVCRVLKVKFTGTGVINTSALEAADVTVTAFGTGNVDCRAAEKLTLYGMGSTTVTYSGSPQLTNRSTGLKIVHRE